MVKNTIHIPPKTSGLTLNIDEVKRALAHVDDFWPRLHYANSKDKGSLIGLPHPYLVPAEWRGNFSFVEQYYWDSYFTSLGISGADERLDVGMLDNLIYLFERFGLIPNASRMYFTGRSQPPILTTYIFQIYEEYAESESWLKERLAVAEREYHNVWMGENHPHWRQVYKGLSRYYDVNVLHDLAEAESGWDMTPRFYRKCLDFLPIDLNALLFKYEKDFARAARMFGDKSAAARWDRAASKRKETVDSLMWDRARGFYFDYDYTSKKRSTISSLASYYPMWAGMVNDKQAKALVRRLEKFETKHGLMTTLRSVHDIKPFGSIKAQWAQPNGWAPLHYIVIEGLERYGYHEDAKRIALKWLRTNTNWFIKNDEFLEKYNVISANKQPLGGVYPSQHGFGWTNGVYTYLAHKYIFDEENPLPASGS